MNGDRESLAVTLDDRPGCPVLVLDVAIGARHRPQQRAHGQHCDHSGAAQQRVDQRDPVGAHARRGGGADRVGHRAAQLAGELVGRMAGHQRRHPQRAVGQAPGAQRGAHDCQPGAVATAQRERAMGDGQQRAQGQLERGLHVVALEQAQGGQQRQPKDGQRGGGARTAPQPGDQNQQPQAGHDRQQVGLRGEVGRGQRAQRKSVAPSVTRDARNHGFDRERRDRESSRLSNGQETDPSADALELTPVRDPKRTIGLQQTRA